MNSTAITPSLPHQLLKPRDAAKLLAISERTLFTLTKKGELPSVRMGKTVRYAQGELAAFVRKQTQSIPGSEPTV